MYRYLGWDGYSVLDSSGIRYRMEDSTVKFVDLVTMVVTQLQHFVFFQSFRTAFFLPFLLPPFFFLFPPFLPHTSELVAWLMHIQMFKYNENLKIKNKKLSPTTATYKLQWLHKRFNPETKGTTSREKKKNQK